MDLATIESTLHGMTVDAMGAMDAVTDIPEAYDAIADAMLGLDRARRVILTAALQQAMHAPTCATCGDPIPHTDEHLCADCTLGLMPPPAPTPPHTDDPAPVPPAPPACVAPTTQEEQHMFAVQIFTQPGARWLYLRDGGGLTNKPSRAARYATRAAAARAVRVLARGRNPEQARVKDMTPPPPATPTPTPTHVVPALAWPTLESDGTTWEQGRSPVEVAAFACCQDGRVWTLPGGTLVRVTREGGRHYGVDANFTTGERYQSHRQSLKECYRWLVSLAREEARAAAR